MDSGLAFIAVPHKNLNGVFLLCVWQLWWSADHVRHVGQFNWWKLSLVKELYAGVNMCFFTQRWR